MTISVNLELARTFEYQICAFENIEDSIQQRPGIYSWMYYFGNSNDQERHFILDIHSERSLEVKVKSNIRFHYEGIINKKTNEKSFDSTFWENLRRFQGLMEYPLYVGISSDLRKRLTTHKKYFLSNITERIESNFQETVGTYNPSENFDSEEESKCFGQRLSNFFLKKGLFTYENLYIKYHTFHNSKDLDTTRAQLREIETLINSNYNPIFGER